jgi:hypothetical protein
MAAKCSVKTGGDRKQMATEGGRQEKVRKKAEVGKGRRQHKAEEG